MGSFVSDVVQDMNEMISGLNSVYERHRLYACIVKFVGMLAWIVLATSSVVVTENLTVKMTKHLIV